MAPDHTGLGDQLAKQAQNKEKSLDYRTRFGNPLTRKTRQWETLEWTRFLDDHEEPKRAREEGADRAPWFPVWQRELHARLYTGDRIPKIGEPSIDSAEAGNLHTALDQLPEFQSVLKRVAQDSYGAGLLTTSLSKKVVDKIAQHAEGDPEHFRALVDMLEEDLESGDDIDPGQIEQAKSDLQDALKDSQDCAGQMDPALVRQAFRGAIQDTNQQLDDIDRCGRALGWGTDRGTSGRGGDPSVKAEVAKRLMNSDRLKELMEMAGRMKNILADVQATKINHGQSEITDIEIGGDVNRLLPSELSNLMDSRRKALLWRRILERGALQYLLESKEKKGRGPIVVCLDDSSSMQGSREIWAKSVALALLGHARKEKRTFCYCTFETVLVKTISEAQGKKLDPVQLLDSLISHASGGTNFDHPIDWALKQVEDEGLEDADVIFISDGECAVRDVEKVKSRIEKAGCKMIGVGIGPGIGPAKSLGQFCTNTFSLSDLATQKGADGEERSVLQSLFSI